MMGNLGFLTLFHSILQSKTRICVIKLHLRRAGLGCNEQRKKILRTR